MFTFSVSTDQTSTILQLDNFEIVKVSASCGSSFRNILHIVLIYDDFYKLSLRGVFISIHVY